MFRAKKQYFNVKNNIFGVKSGFSLGETVIAGFVLSVGLLATGSLIIKSMNDSINSRDHIGASELAQEGTELVRNIRDNNIANSKEYNKGFENKGSYKVNPDNSIIYDPLDFKLYYKNQDKYSHDDSSDASVSKFARRIVINNNDVSSGTKKTTVTSFVSWNNQDPPKDVLNCKTVFKCAYAEVILREW